MDQDESLTRLARINDALDGLSSSDRLDVLEIAWMVTAEGARIRATGVDGFRDERDEQVTMLQRIMMVVQASTPELDLERLAEEGDVSGLMAYVRRRRREADAEHKP